jgi:Dehydrogenases with different specificities (related to short-chain alcohol dehydrogenases)
MENKKIAIVTGGTRGMGKAISEALAEKGNIVYAIYRSDETSAQKTLRAMQAYDSRNAVYKLDVADENAIASFVNDIGAQHGRIDILVNNAGIFGFNYMSEMTSDYLRNVWEVNFMSQYLMTKYVAAYMKKNNYGRVLNASSISGKFADGGLIAYGVSKASVDMLTQISAAELGSYNITVNAYAPGIIHTDMTATMIQERGNEQKGDLCINRFGAVKDVSALVCFLASPEAGYITGEIIGVDGGMFKVQNAYLAHRKAQEEK